jgi:acetylornithine deacetylase/succinyl-diaminopimelate desuccinylase-like protein
VSKNLPTCLLYGHYDVQNADQKDGRKNDPFSLFIGRDKIFGRGVVDNKGQVAIHLQTIFSLIDQGKLGYNLIILLE